MFTTIEVFRERLLRLYIQIQFDTTYKKSNKHVVFTNKILKTHLEEPLTVVRGTKIRAAKIAPWQRAVFVGVAYPGFSMLVLIFFLWSAEKSSPPL